MARARFTRPELSASSVVLLGVLFIFIWLGTVGAWLSITKSEYQKILGGAAFVLDQIDRGLLRPGEGSGDGV